MPTKNPSPSTPKIAPTTKPKTPYRPDKGPKHNPKG